MRITLAAVLMLGCAPVTAPTDAPMSDAPAAWERCPPTVCVVSACSVTHELSCGSSSACAGCEPRCEQNLWVADSGEPWSCAYYLDRPAAYFCGDMTTTEQPLTGCYRRRF